MPRPAHQGGGRSVLPAIWAMAISGITSMFPLIATSSSGARLRKKRATIPRERTSPWKAMSSKVRPGASSSKPSSRTHSSKAPPRYSSMCSRRGGSDRNRKCSGTVIENSASPTFAWTFASNRSASSFRTSLGDSRLMCSCSRPKSVIRA